MFYVDPTLPFVYDGMVKFMPSKDMVERLIMKAEWALVVPEDKKVFKDAVALLQNNKIIFQKRVLKIEGRKAKALRCSLDDSSRVHFRRLVLDDWHGFENVIFMDKAMLPFGAVVDFEVAIELGKPLHEELVALYFGMLGGC